MKNLLFLCVAAMLLLTASKCKDKMSFDIGQPVTLKIGQAAVCSCEKFGFQVEKIKEDSRCPKYTNCVWEGQVVVEVAVKEKGGKTQNLDFTIRGTDKQSAARRVGDYQLRVKQVDPYPEANKTVTKEDYMITLVAEEIKTDN